MAPLSLPQHENVYPQGKLEEAYATARALCDEGVDILTGSDVSEPIPNPWRARSPRQPAPRTATAGRCGAEAYRGIAGSHLYSGAMVELRRFEPRMG